MEIIPPCYIELRGTNDMLIDGVKEIIAYSESTLSVAVSGKTTVNITGDRLILDFLSENRLRIIGSIGSLVFGRGQK